MDDYVGRLAHRVQSVTSWISNHLSSRTSFAPEPNPRLFDDEVEFLGPFLDDPNAPWHYNLFVWLWRGNPTGAFEPLNPDVRCP